MENPINESYSINYDSEKIGIAAIFYIKTEYDTPEMEKTLKEDFEDFKKLFAEMRFDVKSYSGEMKFLTVVKNLQEVSNQIESVHSCFICMIIGHGGSGFITTTNDRGELYIYQHILVDFISHEKLKEKPKIFFFQTCRGTRENVTTTSRDSKTLAGPFTFNPEGSDMLLCYASWEGFVSYAASSEGYGSRYLQDLHNVLREFADGTNSLVDILTVLNRRVSDKLTEGDKFQMPSFESALRRKLFLKIYPTVPDMAPTSDTQTGEDPPTQE